ncbi:RusA family crossover junction endodeoxyribonuclease [Oceanobacillus sp. FSL H7-0719]|uniref:RusA family crossover junction endodeoxyribonuclease n=1 Tax=Oceanobacillus sp. FSL H7-0719 TaxID=2954507 RepID=UPI0032522F7E
MISFVIPGIPIPQGRPRAGRNGRKIVMYDPKESKDYKEYVSLIAKQHAPKTALEGPLSVRVKIYREIPKSTTKKDRALISEGNKRPITKPDTDNYVKSVLDALNGIIFKDDSQVTDLYASKFYSDDPRVEVHVQEIDIFGVVDDI